MPCILESRREGLFCPAGGFFIDPRGKVDLAVITHAHSDHARGGHASYLCSDNTKPLLRIRLGLKAKIESIPFGEIIKIGDAFVSLHPAGHILGSCQVRVEVGGRVWVVSGDYKTQSDRTCESFEVINCHGFVTESTFALPVFEWLPEDDVYIQINDWWLNNAEREIPSILFAYSLGKAQRVLAGVDRSIGPIFIHNAVSPFLPIYEKFGVNMPLVEKIGQGSKQNYTKGLIVAPPIVEDSSLLKQFGLAKRAFASGWMALRGLRRRRNFDKGFVLSDHADWKGLLDVIVATGAESVKITHGNGESLSRYLVEIGIDASILQGYGRGRQELLV
jgi:putative mRNA 3-end processing factor